jgi:hypothetical protein
MHRNFPGTTEAVKVTVDEKLIDVCGGGRPGGVRALRGAPAGVGGVRALVDGRAHKAG